MSKYHKLSENYTIKRSIKIQTLGKCRDFFDPFINCYSAHKKKITGNNFDKTKTSVVVFFNKVNAYHQTVGTWLPPSPSPNLASMKREVFITLSNLAIKKTLALPAGTNNHYFRFLIILNAPYFSDVDNKTAKFYSRQLCLIVFVLRCALVLLRADDVLLCVNY